MACAEQGEVLWSDGERRRKKGRKPMRRGWRPDGEGSRTKPEMDGLEQEQQETEFQVYRRVRQVALMRTMGAEGLVPGRRFLCTASSRAGRRLGY
jgi:hypothetical protein